MARTSTVADSTLELLHYLLKHDHNEEALTCAERMLDAMFDSVKCEYPLAIEYAQAYKYIAVAHTRNQLHAEFWLKMMMDCVHPHRAGQYCASYYEFVGDEQSRTHPFCAYLISIGSSFRHSLRAFRTVKTQ